MMDDREEDLYGDAEMSGLNEHGGGGSLLTKKLVVPGQLVTDDPQFMRSIQVSKLTIEVMEHMLGRGGRQSRSLRNRNRTKSEQNFICQTTKISVIPLSVPLR